MNAQILKIPRRLDLEHYVSLKLRAVDRILERVERDDDGHRERQAGQSTR
jgi:hypothetical protein